MVENVDVKWCKTAIEIQLKALSQKLKANTATSCG